MTSEEDNKSVANDLELKIIQQIEYYFSDINLSKDKFMKEMLEKDEGWIPLETLLTFNRLKNLSSEKSVIISALNKSDSNLLEISECLNKIRRNVDKPLPQFDDNYTKDLNERTIHMKGFPVDTQLDEIMKFCQQFGSVENIEMRRHFKTKKFKGCIFVTLFNKEEAQKLIDSEEVKYKDNNLLRENKVNYFLRKKEFNDKKNSKKTIKKESSENENKTEDKTDDKIEAKEKDEEKDEEEADNEKNEETEVKSEATVNKCPIRDERAVLKLSGVDEKTKFSEIKDFFQKYGKVAFVEDVKQDESFVRFCEKDGAMNALQKLKTDSDKESDTIKVEINGKEVVIELLSGEQEVEYWTQLEKSRTDNNRKRSLRKREFNDRGKRGRNMWQRGRKRGYKGSGDRNGKRTKTDDFD